MNFKNLFLAFLVVVGWGFNFVFIHWSLLEIPPLFLCTLRFLLSAVPGIFFFPRPKAPLPLLLGYGFLTFACQFSLLFLGMANGMPAGLASLVMQIQAFFTIGLAVYFFRDRPTAWKITGAIISFSGIALVAWHTGGEVKPLGLLFTLAASFSWAAGNMCSKKIGSTPPLALVCWGSLVATPIVFALSLVVEGPERIAASMLHLTWAAIGSVAYIVYISTLVCYSLWSYLLNRVPTAVIAPFTLLVPVFGFLSAVILLGEGLPAWKLLASLLVVIGLCFNTLETKWKAAFFR